MYIDNIVTGGAEAFSNLRRFVISNTGIMSKREIFKRPRWHTKDESDCLLRVKLVRDESI